MTPLRIGDLRHKVTFSRVVETANGKGGYSSDFAEVATVWAEVTGLDGRESVMDNVLQGISVYRLRIRWRGDLQASDQIDAVGDVCFGTDPDNQPRPVNIRSLVDPDGRRKQLIIIADTASTRSET